MKSVRRSRGLRLLAFLLPFTLLAGCKTRSELRQEQDLEKLKMEVAASKGERADVEVMSEETKEQISSLANVVDERNQQTKGLLEDIRKELTALTARVQALEQRAVTEDLAAKQAADERSKASYENAKRLFDDGNYEGATEMLRAVIGKAKSKEAAKPAHFLLGESLFASKDFASAALEFSEFQKDFPREYLVPTAIYRQANAFRSLGKAKEAKLFYQELIERFPKSPLAAKAKSERKRLK